MVLDFSHKRCSVVAKRQTKKKGKGSRKMSNEILIALFSLIGTLVGSGGGILV